MSAEITQFIQDKVVLLSEVSKQLNLVLVMPARNATSERSFNALKQVKTVLRSIMSQNRLNTMMSLHVYTAQRQNRFVGISEHRYSIFGKFQ